MTCPGGSCPRPLDVHLFGLSVRLQPRSAVPTAITWKAWPRAIAHCAMAQPSAAAEPEPDSRCRSREVPLAPLAVTVAPSSRSAALASAAARGVMPASPAASALLWVGSRTQVNAAGELPDSAEARTRASASL